MATVTGNSNRWRRLSTVSIAIGCAVLTGGAPLVLANGFSGIGIPGRREGAGTRSTCMVGGAQSVPLLPVIPESQLGVTLEGYPTFFWYLPQSKASAAQFVLYDRYRGQELYRTTLSLVNAPGIASFQLPNDGSVRIPRTGLEVGKTYYWTLTLLCNNPLDPSDRSGDLRVQGFVQRVNPPRGFQEKVRSSNERDLPALYAAQGIWHETLTSLT
ncbi:MAG: DUF928 domain-containing protein, partial [Cyanobacteria bacterium]|nr:DUF928 domain-containing protein [Cyanobacteriota bacterium]MDW8200265.1 DUF928 domain-containing protein [Cyanobacteriota bacterium SKYGB_h_bin112]